MAIPMLAMPYQASMLAMRQSRCIQYEADEGLLRWGDS